eukprot:gene21003-biopygen20555
MEEAMSMDGGRSGAGGFVPLTDALIHGAVAMWCSAQRSDAMLIYGPIGDWDVSSVTNLDGLFAGQRDFNDDVSRWDVSHVTSMTRLFYGAEAFNQPLESWDVANVTNMLGVFDGAVVFNQPLAAWRTGRVTTLAYAF